MKALECVAQQPSPVVVSVPSEGLVSIELRIQLSPFMMPAIKIYKSQMTKKEWDKNLNGKYEGIKLKEAEEEAEKAKNVDEENYAAAANEAHEANEDAKEVQDV